MRIVSIGKHKKLWDEEGKARSFEKLGHKVLRCEEPDVDIDKIKEFKPDFVLWAKLKCYNSRQIVNSLDCTTVCWHPDLYFGLFRENRIGKRAMWEADIVLSPDGGHQDKFKKMGINHHVVRQGIYDEDCVKYPKVPERDILFVGSDYYKYRTKIMQWIADNYDFKWVGKRDSEEYRGDDLSRLVSDFKIVMGDSFPSPNYWSNRIYEMIGRGAFVIHPYTTGIEDEFTPYKHFVPYNMGDTDGLREKLEYFLKNDKKRKEIAKEGYNHVKNNLTLMDKCQEVINYVKASK